MPADRGGSSVRLAAAAEEDQGQQVLAAAVEEVTVRSRGGGTVFFLLGMGASDRAPYPVDLFFTLGKEESEEEQVVAARCALAKNPKQAQTRGESLP